MKKALIFFAVLFLAVGFGCSKSSSDDGDGGGQGAEFDASLYYTKTDSDARYYTMTAADALLADKQEISSNRVLSQNANSINLQVAPASFGRTTAFTPGAGITVPTGANSIMVLISVDQDVTAGGGDIMVRFCSENSNSIADPRCGARLSGLAGQGGTTYVAWVPLSFFAGLGDTEIYPYIESCTILYGGDAYIHITPIMWLR